MVELVATYRPAWRDGTGQAVPGADEDATTMAVAAATPLVGSSAAIAHVRRVVVVTRTPALLEGPTPAVIATALGLRDTVPVEVHLGGGPAVLDVLGAAAPGTVVIGVDTGAPAAAAAALVADSGAGLEIASRAAGHLPARVRAPGEPARVYDDPRLLREQGWRRALAGVGSFDAATTVVVGVSAALASAFPADARRAEAVGAQGAAAPLLALAALAADGTDGTIVAVEVDTVVAATVVGTAALTVRRDELSPCDLPSARASAQSAPPIPASAAALDRAFAAKVGFAAGRCECGALELPPRSLCLACGRTDAFVLERLPRTGTVYTCATIHAPVPGRHTPYSLAIVDIDDAGIRHLAPVTGAPPGSVAIGARGRLVLRCLAEREVGPDYGWSFLPSPVEVSA